MVYIVDKHSRLTHTQQLHPTSLVYLQMCCNVPLILFLSTDTAFHTAAGIRHPEDLLLTITQHFLWKKLLCTSTSQLCCANGVDLLGYICWRDKARRSPAFASMAHRTAPFVKLTRQFLYRKRSTSTEMKIIHKTSILFTSWIPVDKKIRHTFGNWSGSRPGRWTTALIA